MRGPLRSAIGPVPETDATVASQSSYTKVFASSGSFQNMCVEMIGLGQNRPVQIPPLPLTLSGERFATQQTMTVVVILPVPSLCCIEHIGRSNASSCLKQKQKPLTLFDSAKFAFRILLFVWISMIIQEMYSRRKIQINKNSDAADDRQLAADKARPIGIGFSRSFTMLCG